MISGSPDAVVRQLVGDARAFFGLSPTMVEALEKDRASRGLDYGGYIQDLLTQRYREILRAEFEREDAHKEVSCHSISHPMFRPAPSR